MPQPEPVAQDCCIHGAFECLQGWRDAPPPPRNLCQLLATMTNCFLSKTADDMKLIEQLALLKGGMPSKEQAQDEGTWARDEIQQGQVQGAAPGLGQPL
ncbi:hypothetical protein TURU_169357 [Turdus rufiventris]|nr:hypothetical protein TURU_169357 [Turdus rufiventris]